MEKSRGESAPGSALPLESFADDARSLDAEAFAARHGSGFLLVSAAAIDGPQSTTATRLWLDGEDEEPAAHTASLAVLVHPLRQKGGSSGHLVTLGRETRHDVVIADASVSRFHAFAKRGDDGIFLLQDMGSTNGTTVNGVSVPARGAGRPIQLKPGDTVRLGQIEFTFTDARALREFVLQAAR